MAHECQHIHRDTGHRARKRYGISAVCQRTCHAEHPSSTAPSPRTRVAGGLQAIAPLFQPLKQAFIAQLRSEQHWHADETRWAVFAGTLGKVGHRWYLWVFHASTVVHYVLEQTRSAQVVTDELLGIERGVISCDRYSAYKKFARLHPGVVLAYCWAHQRRDFLELANSWVFRRIVTDHSGDRDRCP